MLSFSSSPSPSLKTPPFPLLDLLSPFYKRSLLVAILLPSVTPAMVIYTAPGIVSPFLPSSYTTVKAHTTVGPDLHYKTEFSSLEESAPLLFLNPADPKTCPGCCESFSPNISPFSSSSSSSLRLSPSASSLVGRRTVLMSIMDVESCIPPVNVFTGFETMHVALEEAGARAVILTDINNEPGWSSNCVGSFSSLSDQREARASRMPFVSVGLSDGEKIIESLQNFSPPPNTFSSNSTTTAFHNPSHVHVRFTYDANEYLETYHAYFEVPFKFVSFLTVALVLLRCHSLGLKLDPTTHLPLLNSTKNIVVLLALPFAAAIMCSVSLNGMAVFDHSSRMWVYYSAGVLLPCSKLASSVLVVRFWNSRKAASTRDDSGVPGAAVEDPAKAQPVRTVLIVVVGLVADVLFSTSAAFSNKFNPVIITSIVSLLALGNIYTMAYFFFSAIPMLRSLSPSTEPLRKMAVYLLLMAVFTLMIISAFAMVGSTAVFQSSEAFFATFLLTSIGNYGATLCHLFIFTSKKNSDTGGSEDETFLERENRLLAERYRVQNEAIARLEAENNESRVRAELEQQLLRASELQTETEKIAKLGLQREKSSFMAALHEVRNPLNGIVLTLEHIDDSLSAQIGGEELREELLTIKTCAGHQTLLLKSIMDLDKIMAGNKELPSEDFNPAKICSQAIAMNKHAAKPGVSISLNASPQADFDFVGAPTQLNLVLVNLMSNALKFTKEGVVELSVAVLEDADAGVGASEEVKDSDGDASHERILRFAVTDTGPGVPREQQEKIFGMRGQAGNETSKAKGFGFGLFVAHELVERMGGRIVLQSPVVATAAVAVANEEGRGRGEGGGGSMFSFEIRVGKSVVRPSLAESVMSLSASEYMKWRLSAESAEQLVVVKVDGAAQKAHAAARSSEKEEEAFFGEVLTTKGWKVLLADDSELNLRLLERKLVAGPFKKLGWVVETATTGEEALKMIRETSGREGEGRRFDLVIFDENMQPEGLLTGTAATRILRNEDERVLIVGCTGNSTDDDRKRSEESGQDLFWTKPAPPSKNALEDLVGALVKRRHIQNTS